MFRQRVVWSECELSHLKQHQDDNVSQLAAYLAKSINAVRNKIKEINGEILPDKKNKAGKRSNIGKREDLGGRFLRSSWEANCLRYFNYKVIKWFYEPDTFSFLNMKSRGKVIKHGTVSYTPDFLLLDGGKEIYLEVKGFLKTSDKTRIRRFKELYPVEFAKLQCIVSSSKTKAAEFFAQMEVPVFAFYSELNKQYKSIIAHWE